MPIILTPVQFGCITNQRTPYKRFQKVHFLYMVSTWDSYRLPSVATDNQNRFMLTKWKFHPESKAHANGLLPPEVQN